MALAFLLVLYTYLGFAAALSKEGWRSQSIYQLLTDRYARTDGSTAPCADLGDYCGGSWQGITNNLDYIQDMGFTAIWISPITENIPGITYEGAAYHGFWPQQINQINSNFGTAADLKALSNAVHARGMYLMVDMVTNDMAWNGNYTTVDYSVYDVFDDSSYYHPYCPITDYQNSTNAVECWSGDQHISLPDLATDNSVVVDKWQAWVSNITAFYGIDGIRLDACLEQNKQFFTSFESAAGVYIICEAYDYPIDVVCDYQNYVSGLLNFPMWYLVIDAFGSISGSISNLYNGITQIQGNCTDVSLLGNFVENHDVNRFPYTVTDIGLDQNAIAFVMLNDGIPIIYAGEEQHYSGGAPPADRETTWTSNYNTTTIYYQLITKINALRKCVIAKDSTYTTTESVPFYLDTQVLGVKKGASPTTQVVGVFNNRGTGAVAYTINMTETGWSAGEVIYEMYTQQSVTVTPEGYLPVYMYGGQPRIYVLLSSYQCCSGIGSNGGNSVAGVANLCLTTSSSSTSTTSSTSTPITSTVPSTSAIATSSTVLSSSTPIVLSTSSTAISSTVLSSSTPIVLSTSSTAISSTVLSSSTPIILSTSSTAISSTVLSSSTPIVLSTSSTVTSSTVVSSSSPGSSSSSAVLPSSTPIVLSTSSTVTSSTIVSSSSPGSSSSSAVLPSSTTSSAEASVLPASSAQSSSQGTSTSNPISTIPSLSSSSGSPSATPASTASTSSGVTIPATSSASTASNVPVAASSSAAPAPATAAPICPSADGNTFIANGQEFIVGCAIASDQEYFAQMPGTDIADCVHVCTTYAGTTVCTAVTYSDGSCYLKSISGAIYNENSSDSAFVISTPNGPETVASGYLAGNISQAAPTCPYANGNTFEFNGYFYVVACNIDNYVVDISTAPGADLATCVESCISFSGTTSCTTVTQNNGTCHFKASVGTTFHVPGASSAFIIADNVNPIASPSGPPGQIPPPSGNLSLPSNPTGNPILPSNPIGNPILPSNPTGHPSLPPNFTGTFTIISETEVTVWEPQNIPCPG